MITSTWRVFSNGTQQLLNIPMNVFNFYIRFNEGKNVTFIDRTPILKPFRDICVYKKKKKIRFVLLG